MLTDGFMDRVRSGGRGLLGTWVKIPALETVELLAHAGFEFVVIDMEHGPLGLDKAYELIFAAQAMGMSALVRLPDHVGTTIQPLLDAGADGLLVPRMTTTDVANTVTAKMVFAPTGERGLGFTSRAGRWGMIPMPDYLKHGDEQTLRMIQLEDWETLEAAADFAKLPHVNGIFIGIGDLALSSGRGPGDPQVKALIQSVFEATKEADILSGIVGLSPADAKYYFDMGFSLVMVSNDATLLGRAAAGLVKDCLETDKGGA